MVAINRFFSRFPWDVVGFSASAICAIHCLAIPVFLVVSSFSGIEFIHNHSVEDGILIFSATIGSLSIIPSFFRHHKKAVPFVLFLAGITLVALGRFDIQVFAETILTAGGASLVAIAHWINWKLCLPFHVATESKST